MKTMRPLATCLLVSIAALFSVNFAADSGPTKPGAATSAPSTYREAHNIFAYPCSDGSPVKGDGVHDDTGGIQGAIDAASKAGGGVIFIPNGTYSITRTLHVRSGVRIAGAGDGSIILPTLKWPKQKMSPAMMLFDGVTGAALSNVKIDFRGSVRRNAGAIDSPGLLIQKTSNECLIDDVTFYDAGLRPSQSRPTGPVIEVNSSSRCRIRDCRFIQPGDPAEGAQCAFAVRVLTDFSIQVPKELCEYNVIEGSYFEGPFNWNVIELAGPGVRNNMVRSNIFSRCSALTCVDMDKGASFNSAVNNTVESANKTSLYLNDPNTRFAIYADHGNDPFTEKSGKQYPAHSNVGNRFTGNSARNAASGSSDVAECFLFLQRTSRGTYSQNVFEMLNEGQRGCGIWIDSCVSRITIMENQISEVKQGITLGPIASGEIGYLDISHNQIESNGTALTLAGKQLSQGWGIGCRVIGNDLSNRTSAGYALAFYDQCPALIVSSNTLSGGLEGMYCGSPGAVVTGNVIRSAKERSIRVGNTGPAAFLSGNQSVQPGIADLIVHEGATPPKRASDQ